MQPVQEGSPYETSFTARYENVFLLQRHMLYAGKPVHRSGSPYTPTPIFKTDGRR
ncbi:hypothetical protein [Chlorogloeopsis sp. ULAP02]|uniref:hypothetical protein n=1 Tax=Chlorogloeopsis sp. ULAP02 TaxID=3107926 RepID=UPI00398A5DD9